ncbi:metallophosphoesterase family protein [Streptococcus moroccensis]|uniref:Phosphodiesterase n=1 Tax=Streptococcus moroccensis TaxID=1451356 RepID=A0ABT9YNF0_9STRE|nr:metallophosphoesterase family protein [Streptococcus moroccensis]MDQ0221515.1 putative phosphodiesterase [Streptococcus moroccensis]
MKHRIALLSDIHGNRTALEAVLEDLKNQEITGYWLLGDIFMPGPGTRDLIALLDTIPISLQVRGNWEDCFLESLDNRFDPNNPTDIYLAKLSQYLHPHLSDREIATLRELPLQETRTINGLTISVSHHLPQKNYGRELVYDAPAERLDDLFIDSSADIAIYGHIHVQTQRYASKGQLVINPGSIGQPYYPWDKLRKDLRAQYAILEIDEQGVSQVLFKKVSFDLDLELERAREAHLPYLDLYTEIMKDGIAHTHDKPLLTQINQDRGYYQDVMQYFGEGRKN